MKICHMTSAHDSDDIRILKKQCVSLAKNENNEVFLVAKGENFEYKGVKVIGIGNPQGGRLNRIFKVGKLVYKKAAEIDADIYEFHDPELMLYAKKLKKAGKKVIFDSHENYKEQIMNKGYIPFFARRIVRRVYSIIEANACKYIDAVLYPEEDSPYVNLVKDCVVIRNTPIDDELTPEKDFREKENIVCCVGTLSEDRGIKFLIEACYKTGVKLILGGKFSPYEFGESLKKDKAFSIVDYRGICNREEVKEIYNDALIGADTILPVGQYPYARSLSTKVYEYMAMGLPYITSNFDYNRKIIDEHNCGIYVNPADANEIAEKIAFLIDNRNAAQKMGQNGNRLLKEEFSWSIDEKRLYMLYARLEKVRV